MSRILPISRTPASTQAQIILPPIEGGTLFNRDAVEIGQLYRNARSSVVDSVRYLIKRGVELTEKNKSLDHGEWLPWLEANADVLGFDNRTTAFAL